MSDGLSAAPRKSVMTAFDPSAASSAPAGVCIHELAMRIHSAERQEPNHTSQALTR